MLQTAIPLPAWITRRPITVDDYYRMGEAGILTEDDRVELIEGQIIEMAPIGSDHAGTVNTFTRLLVTTFGARAIVSVQNPVRLSPILEPQPDFALLKPRTDGYRTSHPTAPDVLLIIEVANSSLTYDRTIKAALYARHTIPEFWLIDLTEKALIIHTDPENGAYTKIQAPALGDCVRVAAFPDTPLSVAELLG